MIHSFVVFNIELYKGRAKVTSCAGTVSSRLRNSMQEPLIGVLALQGAFEEHQKCLAAVGCRTRQVSSLSPVVSTQIII